MKYRQKFGLPKYQLIYISKKRIIDHIAGVKLRGGHLVQEINTAINLDITL